jgi:hypothetical protein
MVKSKDDELAIMEFLQVKQETRSEIIPVDIEYFEHFGLSQSLRYETTSTARARGINNKISYVINRWKILTLAMQEHYTDSCVGQIFFGMVSHLGRNRSMRVSSHFKMMLSSHEQQYM